MSETSVGNKAGFEACREIFGGFEKERGIRITPQVL